MTHKVVTQNHRFPSVILRQFIRHNSFGDHVFISNMRVTPSKVVVLDVHQSIDAKEMTIFDRINNYLNYCSQGNWG